MPLFSKTKKTEHIPKSSDASPSRLSDKLAKTRNALARGLYALVGGVDKIDAQLFDDLEDALISADLGVAASAKIIHRVRNSMERRGLKDTSDLLSAIRDEMDTVLKPCEQTWSLDAHPYVLMVVGVNGVGKTTTIAKIAQRLMAQRKSVMLAAADTFRAAAVEQLVRWGERLKVPVVGQAQGADAAAVAHDALISAQAKSADVLIIDTAGRQHTQSDLMEQLRKMKRVLRKLEATAPHEVLQVLDAGTGQNALSQLEHFNQAVEVDSLCVTKLDGTAKGGVLLAIADRFPLPVRFIGVGEGASDLRPFDKKQFIDALLPDADTLRRPN